MGRKEHLKLLELLKYVIFRAENRYQRIKLQILTLRRKHHRRIFVLGLLVVSAIYLTLLLRQNSLLSTAGRKRQTLFHPNLGSEIKNSANHKPTILIWYPPFKRENDYFANYDTCGGHVDCHVTYDRERLEESGAVVFHFRSTEFKTMPTRRDSNQLFIWWSGEKNHGAKWKEFDNIFNLTFTYRRDSGIFAPYGTTSIILNEMNNENEINLDALLEKKRKSGKVAAWAVSNCGVEGRMKLGRNIMNAGLEVDTFGSCFGGREIGDGQYSKTFYQALSEYKFYFAFENGYHCKDYITEKFWYNSLRSGAVPIVWGPKKEDVAAVAPKNSFIHVEDYDTVEDLVDYLYYLMGNESAYREHLKWREWIQKPELIEERFLKPEKELHSFCRICKILQEQEYAIKKGHKRVERIVPSLYEWWWKRENENCIHYDLFDFRMPQDGVLDVLSRAGVKIV